MTALVSVAQRLDNALEALQPLITSAHLDDDAAFARRQFNMARGEIVGALRIVNGLNQPLAHVQRRQAPEPAGQGAGRIVIDGVQSGALMQGERVHVTFDRAARLPRTEWALADNVDGEGSEL